MGDRYNTDKHFSSADNSKTACYGSDTEHLSQISVDESQTYSTTSIIERADAPERTKLLPLLVPIGVMAAETVGGALLTGVGSALVDGVTGLFKPKPNEDKEDIELPPRLPQTPSRTMVQSPNVWPPGYPQPSFQQRIPTPTYGFPYGYPQGQFQPQVPPGYRFQYQPQYVWPAGYPQAPLQQQIPALSYGVPNRYLPAQIQTQVPPGYPNLQVPSSFGQNPLPTRSKNRVSHSSPTRPSGSVPSLLESNEHDDDIIQSLKSIHTHLNNILAELKSL